MYKKTFATFAFSFLFVSCGAVANSDQPINDPIPTDSLEPAVRLPPVTVSVEERNALGICFWEDIQIAEGSYEVDIGEGRTEFGFIPCRPFTIEPIVEPTAPTNPIMMLPETK